MNPVRNYEIPFNRPSMAGRELELIREAVSEGHVSGDGRFTRSCERLLEEIVGTKRALLTTSCTDALEMAALLLEVGQGDEVVVPSYTFVSTANAFALRGAKIIFADVRPDTLNLDESRLEELLSPRTRAIVVVHYGGVGCEMDAITSTASMRGIPVIEDNAHGLFGSYRGRSLGSIGSAATLSFHETKNISCGEGGAILLNDPDLIGRAEIVRDKGTNRSKYYRGQVDKYTWVDLGSSFLPSDILAAYLFAQLGAREAIQSARRKVFERYMEALRSWAESNGARLPFVPPHCEQPFHLFYLLMPSPESRDALIRHLADRSILAVFHYQPLHLSTMGARFGARPGDCPVSEHVAERLVRLPFFTSMSDSEQLRVIDAVLSFQA